MKIFGFTLAEGATHVAISHNCRRIAFTLAEVLITLGIIGVVAALTMPTLIQKHQKQAYVTGFKKGVSVVDNMFKKMQADEGASSFWNTELISQGVCEYYSQTPCEDLYGNPSVFERIIPKYIKTVKVCKGSECSVKYSYYNNYSKNTDGIVESVDASSLVRNKSITDIYNGPFCSISLPETSMLGFYTSDGAIYYIIPGGDVFGAIIAIDSNGEKGPNIFGRDLLMYSYNKGKVSLNACSSHKYAQTIVESGWKMNY